MDQGGSGRGRQAGVHWNNPAGKLTLPPTRGACERFLTITEYRQMLEELEGRDLLISVCS
jgi:hypothetical protein